MAIFPGTPGDDVLRGTDDDDVLWGGGGDDELYGLAGNDRLEGGPGADTLDGGDHGEPSTADLTTWRDNIWGDTAIYKTSDAGVTINLATAVAQGGHAEGDVLTGIESIRGSDLADTLTARDDDPGTEMIDGSTLWGDRGDDILSGGTGGDLLWGGKGDDTLAGGGSSDYLEGGAGADMLDGGEGVDRAGYELSDTGVTVNLATGEASGGHADGDRFNGIEHIRGSAYADVLTAIDDDPDTEAREGSAINGDKGNDTLRGGTGNDYLHGGEGADVVSGGEGIDTVQYSLSNAGVMVNLETGTAAGGHAEGDTLTGFENVWGSSHADHLVGDSGDNLLASTGGDDTLIGGAGNDTLILTVGSGDSLLVGGEGNDELWGYSGNDTLDGGTGDDELDGAAGADVLDGGDGRDTARYDFSDAGVTIDLAMGTGAGGHAEGDTLTGIENLNGSAHADHFTGDDGDNWAWGQGGDDTLRGGAGNDYLNGGDGEDLLTGGEGADTFVFGNGDRVTDYQDSSDWIDIRALGHINTETFGTSVAIRQNGDDVEIQIGDAVLTLAGVSAADVTADDFLFA